MTKAQNKTVETDVSPDAFIASVEPEKKRLDAEVLLALFNRVTGLKPKMWGARIVGYGRYKYKYETGREGEFLITGFTPSKAKFSIHILPGYRFPTMQEKLARLGKHKLGKSCLYVNKLADIDLDVLGEIIQEGVEYMRANYETWDA